MQYSGAGIPGGNFFYEDDLNLGAQNNGGTNNNYRTDGHGRRVLKWLSPNTQHTFYIFDVAPTGLAQLIGEIDRNGVPQVAYTWGRDGLVSERLIPSGQSLYYHFGPQGETRQLTDSSGSLTDTYVYNSYGLPVATTGTSYNPHKYGGRFGYYDHGLNVHLLVGRRWYSPYLMRWLTHDPIGYEGGTNLYQYVEGNPVRYVDPSGEDLEEIMNPQEPNDALESPDLFFDPFDIFVGIATVTTKIGSRIGINVIRREVGETSLRRLVDSEVGAIGGKCGKFVGADARANIERYKNFLRDQLSTNHREEFRHLIHESKLKGENLTKIQLDEIFDAIKNTVKK